MLHLYGLHLGENLSNFTILILVFIIFDIQNMKFVLKPNENEFRVVSINKFDIIFKRHWIRVETLFEFGYKYFFLSCIFQLIHNQLGVQVDAKYRFINFYNFWLGQHLIFLFLRSMVLLGCFLRSDTFLLFGVLQRNLIILHRFRI